MYKVFLFFSSFPIGAVLIHRPAFFWSVSIKVMRRALTPDNEGRYLDALPIEKRGVSYYESKYTRNAI